MRIVIPGGSGQVGTALAKAFVADGHDVVVLGRSPKQAEWRTVKWDGKRSAIGRRDRRCRCRDQPAGRSVNCRYNETNRREIWTRGSIRPALLARPFRRLKIRRRFGTQSSTATIYAHSFDRENDDVTGVIGGHEPDAPDTWNFSIDVATNWERVTNEAQTPDTRKVIMRSAMTMGPARGGSLTPCLASSGSGSAERRQAAGIYFLDTRRRFHPLGLLAY